MIFKNDALRADWVLIQMCYYLHLKPSVMQRRWATKSTFETTSSLVDEGKGRSACCYLKARHLAPIVQRRRANF